VLPSIAYALGSCVLTDTVILVHPIGTASVAPQCLETAYSGHPNTSSLYASRWFPVTNQIITFSAPVSSSSAQSLSLPPPPPPPPTHTSADDRRSGIQGESDLIQLEQKIISSHWYASNTLEPTCGSADCPEAADYYGIRGMSCYTAFVVPNLDGTFGCWWEGCSAYAAQRLDDAVKHQRSNHFNHKPFLCVPTNSTAWLVSLRCVSAVALVS